MTNRHGASQSYPVSVIICVRNRESVLAECLKSVNAAAPAEVIIVDGASTDRTVEVAAAAGYDAVSDGGAGLGAARQLGARIASNAYVAYVDSDVVLEPDTLATLLREAKRNDWDAVQARLLGLGSRPSYWQRAEAWRRSVQERPGAAAALGCQATLIRRDLLLDVAFDPAFTGAAEDGDFFFRARKAGAKIAFACDAIAYHDDRRDFWSFARQRIWHGRGLARIIVRHRLTFQSSAVRQADTAAMSVAHNLRYLPFMVVSVGCLVIGLTLELLRMGLDRRLVGTLRSTNASKRD